MKFALLDKMNEMPVTIPIYERSRYKVKTLYTPGDRCSFEIAYADTGMDLFMRQHSDEPGIAKPGIAKPSKTEMASTAILHDSTAMGYVSRRGLCLEPLLNLA
jgi:hypothetical protein